MFIVDIRSTSRSTSISLLTLRGSDASTCKTVGHRTSIFKSNEIARIGGCRPCACKYPGHKLTVGYSLGEVNDASDASVIRWYIVADDGTETLSCSSTANADKSFTIPSEAEGKRIKVVVIPQTISGTTGEAAEYKVEAFVREGYEDPSSTGSDIELGKGVNIFLAGDSTVKDYSANGMYMSGKAQAEGSWGEYLQSFFDDSKVKVVNYANGGRSSRNFINEGSLDKIAENIKAGDYLFIQFGHNDCSNQSGYLEDRYVPLGTPDESGIYPTTAGTKVAERHP